MQNEVQFDDKAHQNQHSSLSLENKKPSIVLIISLILVIIITTASISGIIGFTLGKRNKNDSNPKTTTTIVQESSTTTTNTLDSLDINFDENEVGGCSNLFIYKGDTNQTEYITVNLNREKLKIKSGRQTFKIEEDTSNYINVTNDKFNPGIDKQDNAYFPYCNDIAPIAKATSYRAISGEVEVTISDPDTEEQYSVDIILNNVIFEIDSDEVILGKLEIKEVQVGWYPG